LDGTLAVAPSVDRYLGQRRVASAHAAETGPEDTGRAALEATDGRVSFALDAGTKPADLPVEQPTRFNLVLNQTTAEFLGLTFPESVLQQATEIIQ
jgi:hypothetical protein